MARQKLYFARKRKRLIGVAPGSKWESKIWSEERFYKVIERLIAEKNVFPVVFGGREDREKGNRLINRWGIGANAAGELDIDRRRRLLRNVSFTSVTIREQCT
jgi:heptosyltransferase-2